jgi:hypothetical protein
MRKLAILVAAAVALGTTANASADGTSAVGVYGCFVNGGHVTRPAGTQLVAVTGWAAKTRGLVEDFLQAQTTTLVVNGSTPIDASSMYDEATTRDPGDWVSFVRVPTGVTLAPGESATLTFTLAVSHRLTDGELFANGERGRPQFLDTGAITYSCTVTGV